MVMSLLELDGLFQLKCDPVSKALEKRRFENREDAIAAMKKFRRPTGIPSKSKSFLKAKARRDRIRARSDYKAKRAELGNKC